MEELSGSGALGETKVHVGGDLGLRHIISGGHVSAISQLEETLNTARGVLWASTVVAVRKKHHEAGLDIPLRLS